MRDPHAPSGLKQMLAGFSVAKDLPIFRKLGWRIVLVSLTAAAGTFLGGLFPSTGLLVELVGRRGAAGGAAAASSIEELAHGLAFGGSAVRFGFDAFGLGHL